MNFILMKTKKNNLHYFQKMNFILNKKLPEFCGIADFWEEPAIPELKVWSFMTKP